MLVDSYERFLYKLDVITCKTGTHKCLPSSKWRLTQYHLRYGLNSSPPRPPPSLESNLN